VVYKLQLSVRLRSAYYTQRHVEQLLLVQKWHCLLYTSDAAAEEA